MLAKLSFIITILCILITCSCGPERSIEDQMQEILDDGIKEYNVHGVSSAVIFSDDKIWTGVSGVSYDTVTIKPDMLFAIGSITKNIVSALTLRLVEENILSLEDPLSKWLPHYLHIDSTITIRQLLNHTSGLYMFWNNEQIWDDLKNDRSRIWLPEEVLKYIKEPHFAPGEGWRYSNTNYLLMAMIINKATDSNLSSELKKHFWQPLGMDNVFLSQEEPIPDNQAHVYGDNIQFGNSEKDVTFEPRASHESITYGSSGIFTTAENLARWSYMLFDGKILKQQSMNEMLQFIEFEPVANMRSYGLGVQTYVRNFSSGKEAIGHGGGNIGTSTYMVYLPEHHVSIVVMINAFPSASIDVITKGLIRAVLRDLNSIGIIPYFEFFPTGFILLFGFISIIIIIFFLLRKRLKHR